MVEIQFADVDGDGEREVVVENSWLRVVLRFPEKLGFAYYRGRFTWGGRLQSLVYKPTGREFFLTRMIDLEGINPFGLPDELFALFPLEGGRSLKMGVGVFAKQWKGEGFEPLPWTWHTEEANGEQAVVFRQEVDDLEGYSYLYEKRYRFRSGAAWFALDVVWENRGGKALSSAWDIHSFHEAGAPPRTAWLVAPKRAWLSCGKTRVRVLLKEASPIFATPAIEEMVSDRIRWDMEGTPWWYALGPGDGEEFYLLRARFEPNWGMFWAGYGAFTPQGICDVEVPPGERAVWGFDVILGSGARNFVAAGENCGLSMDREDGKVMVSVQVAERSVGRLEVRVRDRAGRAQPLRAAEGVAGPGRPLRAAVELPATGEYAAVDFVFSTGGGTALRAEEVVPLVRARPTAHLPFAGEGAAVLVAVNHRLERPEADGRYLWCHATQAGFEVDWTGPGVAGAAALGEYRAICLVGDAWPLARVEELRAWTEGGGGLLLCAPFGELAAALGEWLPLRPLAGEPAPQPSQVIVSNTGMARYAEGEWQVEGGPAPRIWRRLHTQTLEQVWPVVGLRPGAPHCTAERLMLEPDAKVRIGYWVRAAVCPGAVVTLEFTDEEQHPAVALRQAGKGRVAAVASRPAWGAHYRKAVWDGWGQYHRAFWAGLVGWLAGQWPEGE